MKELMMDTLNHTVRFFIYKNCIAAKSNLKNATLLNDITKPENKDGILVSLSQVIMPKKVKIAILNRHEFDDTLAKLSISTECIKGRETMTLFLLGFNNHLLAADGFNVIIDSKTNLTTLKEIPEDENIVDVGFKQYIDSF